MWNSRQLQSISTSAGNTMKIAFLTHQDPNDRGAWSGILFYMLQALNRHGGEVVPLGPAGSRYRIAGKLAQLTLLTIGGQKIDHRRTIALSKAFARIFERKLACTDADVIFAPVASVEFAFLNTRLPIVRYEDVTARIFQDYAERLEGLSEWSLRQCEVIETRALERADRLVYPSEWAARSAVRDYGVAEAKVKIIPMGANLDEIPTQEEIVAIRKGGASRNCRLLFVGTDWNRKGGDIALSAMQELRRRGINASLTGVGCGPHSDRVDPNCHVIPFLDKNRPEHRKQICSLFLESDFMVFPSRREAYGIVCCEASAFGLPQIVSDVGGIPVRDGETGIRLPVAASGAESAAALQA